MNEIPLKIMIDNNGMIQSISIDEDNYLEQSSKDIINSFLDEFSGDTLEHHGVKGMKWGHRKDKTRNPNYSDQQVRRDRAIYGKRGSKRINKAMNRGDSIGLARSDEKTRRDKITGRNKYVRQIGKMTGAGAAALGSQIGLTQAAKLASTRTGRQYVNKFLGPAGAQTLSMALNNPSVRASAAVGSATIASMFAGDVAVKTRLRAHGYNPNRKY